MSKLMLIVGIAFISLPCLSLQVIKQYINNFNPIVTISDQIIVEVIDVNNWGDARAYKPSKHISLKHSVNLTLIGTKKLTSSLASVRTPMPIRDVNWNVGTPTNHISDISLITSIRLHGSLMKVN